MGTLETLFPATRRQLLVALFKDPSRPFFLRELIRATGKGQGSVQRELERLVLAGIVQKKIEHGRAFFSPNTDSPVYPEIYSLIQKTAGVPAILKRALEGLSPKISVAFIFGSFARQAEGPDSDVDLALIGDLSFRRVVQAIGKHQLEIGREINPAVYSVAEFRRRVEQGDRFLTELLRTEKIYIIGGEDDLAAVVGESMAGRARDEPG